jgi:hypothetical protein
MHVEYRANINYVSNKRKIDSNKPTNEELEEI